MCIELKIFFGSALDPQFRIWVQIPIFVIDASLSTIALYWQSLDGAFAEVCTL